MLLSLSAGVTDSAASLANSSGVDLLATSANTTLTQGQFPPIAHAHRLAGSIPAADPNVATASPWLVADLVFANQSLYARSNLSPNGISVPPGWAPTGSGVVGWIPGDNGGLEVPTVTVGPGFPSPGDPLYANGTYSGPATHAIVLDDGLAAVLGVHVGAVVYAAVSAPGSPAGLASWFGQATAFRVVGICGPFWLIPSELLAFGYLSEIQSVLGGTAEPADSASLILIHLHDPGTASTDRSRLAAAFPGLTLFTVSDVLGAVASVVNLYRTFGTLIGAIGVVVAILFATTVLLMSVDDRSRDIALLRALGFSPAWIATEVASEGLMLAGFGAIVGAPLGYLGARGVDGFLRGLLPGLPNGFTFVQFDAGVVLAALGLVLAIGIAAAALPVLRALRLPVAEELRAP
jgi:putative ABC transport system permease protein